MARGMQIKTAVGSCFRVRAIRFVKNLKNCTSSGISEGLGNSMFSYTAGEIESCCEILGENFVIIS